MDLPIMYIGLSQSVLGALLILLKKPLKIADSIIAGILLNFALLYGLDILQVFGRLPEDRFMLSISLFMLFPPLLLLYSKYITNDYNRFETQDYLHFAPSLFFMAIAIFFRLNLFTDAPLFDPNTSTTYQWLVNVAAITLEIMLVVYSYVALKRVILFRKNLTNFYSFDSNKINLNWLIFVIIAFVLTFMAIIIVSALFEIRKFQLDIDLFRHVLELFYVYILSLWGFRQIQLDTALVARKENRVNPKPTKGEISISKYKNSGLKSEKAQEHIRKLKLFMQQTESWKDTELSVAKLAAQTNIPKHHITQALNEYLGKNFHQFVNEYRTEFAKKLLRDANYDRWTILAIAYECGFNSKTAFNNFFKKFTGMTPSEFKKHHKNPV